MIPAGYEWARDGQYLPGDWIMLGSGLWGPSTRRVIVVDVFLFVWVDYTRATENIAVMP